MKVLLEPSMLSLIGTTGWLLMLLMKAVMKRSAGLVLLVMIFASGIIDFWEVLPLHLAEKDSLRLDLFYWGLALGPWVVCVVDVVQWLTKKLEQEHSCNACKNSCDVESQKPLDPTHPNR